MNYCVFPVFILVFDGGKPRTCSLYKGFPQPQHTWASNTTPCNYSVYDNKSPPSEAYLRHSVMRTFTFCRWSDVLPHIAWMQKSYCKTASISRHTWGDSANSPPTRVEVPGTWMGMLHYPVIARKSSNTFHSVTVHSCIGREYRHQIQQACGSWGYWVCWTIYLWIHAVWSCVHLHPRTRDTCTCTK
jgi:hypothetical protein